MLHNIWVATDLHLFNTDPDYRHPQRTAQDFNKFADNYGNMIQEDDLFIFLGDLYDPTAVDASEVAKIISSIKGYKVMCRGNHDTESYDFYREIGFDDVCDVLRIHNLIFSHKPVKVAPDELNIHGYLHTEKLSTLGYQYINAYASNYNNGYQPVLVDDLIDSALVQNTDQINPLDKVDEKFEEFTSNRASITYRNVRDLSDQFSLAPMDEATTKKDWKLNLFFVSEHGDYDETIIKPKIPNNYMTQNGFEDNITPRVCFSTSIDGCLMGLSQNITDKTFYVYQPVGKHKIITPTEKQVPDVKITKERWICEPVELTCIGKIKAIDENGPKDDDIPYRYGPNKEHEARLYHWGYRWLEKFNESISPSIVSLSAEVEEDEEKTPLDEILFPDVDSTQYWEADDGSLEKKANPERFSDSRPTHKMVGKNDVAADGQSTMDEDVNYLVPKHPEMIIKTQYLDKDKVTPKTISILAKDLFGERAMIHPELLDQQKLATMKTVNELIDYFNSMSIFVDGSATRSPNGIHIKTPNFVVGAFLFANRKKHTDAIAEADLDVLLPSKLSDAEAFKEYINNSVEALNELEGILCSMICVNLAMIRISINDVINQLMTPGGRKSVIKRAKDYIDDHVDEFVTKFSDGTVLYDYKKLGIDCEVFISDLMYNGSEFKKINRPSRFLVRTAIYDKILVVHGATEQLDHGKYKWTIEPITIYGKQYTDLDEVIHVFKTTHAGRILVISCNTDGVVPDNALYDIVDYASGEVIFESTTSLVSQNGSPKSVLKSIQKHAEKRINELNKIESKVLSEIDSFDMIIVPDEFSYVEIDGTPATAKLITKQIPDDIKKYKKLCGTTTDKLFKFYKEFMFVIYQFTKRLLQTSLVESGYHWDMNDTVVVEDFLFHEDSNNYQSQSIIDNPTANYQYETLEECIHDAALYAEASGSSMYAFNISGGVIDKIQAAVNEDAYEWLSSHNIEDHPLIKRINDIHSAPSVKSFESDIPEVFFTKEITAGSLNKIFSLIYMPGDLPNGWKNMVKISTGEPGGHNYLKPELIGDLVKRINGAICDTVTAYDGNRNTKEKQLKTMKDHGFTDIGEVDVLDGDGELVVPVKDGLILKESLAGSHIMDYDFHLILTHFKGHAMAGFGGAIKNVAIGCSSRRGKSLIHTYGSTADMTIGFGDEYDQQSFLKAMVDAAKSYVDLMKIRGPILYINIANNLSVDCDCSDHPADPTMDDIGIFASWDPVAVDQACIDAVYHAKDSHDLVERIESKDGTDILLYAEESGMGSRSYELINIDLVNENADGSLSLTETKEYNRTDNIGPIEGYPYVSTIWTADAEGSIYINPDYEHINEAAIKVNDITRIVALNNELNDYQYGLSRNNQKIKKQNTTSEDYDKYYRVATPTQFVKQNGGICWDFATYEAFVFKKQFPNIKFKTYYIVFDAAPYYPTHTFLVFEKDMKFYYFESSFKRIQGIWVANSISDIFNFVLYSMNQYRPKDCKASLLKYKYAIFEYNALHPDIPGSTTIEFMNLMEEIGQDIPHVYSSKYDVKPYIDTNDFTVRKTKTKNENDPISSEAVKLDFYLNKEHIAEASISAVDTDKGFLYDFEVFKKYRGKGYGTAILKYVLSHYKVNELTVDKSNTKAIKLYKRFGFKTGVEFKEDGKTRVDMKINLNESIYVSKHQFNGYTETLYHLDAFRKAYQASGTTSHGIPDDVDMVCTFFEDILDNYNQIAPETLNRDKVAACKSADDLIELFYGRAKQFGDDLSSEYTSSLEVLHHLINLKKNPKNNVRFDEIIPMNLSKDKFAAFIAKRVQEMDDIEAFLTNALKSNLQMYGIIRKEIQMLESDSSNKDHVKALKAYMDKHEDDFIHVHKKGNTKTYEYDFGSFGRGKAYVDGTIYDTSHDVVKPTRLLIRASMYDYIIYSHGVDSDTKYAMDDIVIDGQIFNNVADIVTYLQKGAPKRILIMACNNNQVIYDSNDFRFTNVKYPSHELVLESALSISSNNPNKILKEWEAYLNSRLGTMNRVRKRLVHQISDDEFVLYPNKCKLLFAKSNAKDGKLIYQESFNISDQTTFVNAVVSSIESIIRLYEQVCFTCKMMIHIIHDAYNDTLTESGYGWEIKPVTGMSWSPDDYRFGYQYHTMQECFHDLTMCHELFFESTNCCGRIYSAENPKYWCFTSKTLEPAILEAYYKYSKSELQEAIDQFIHAQNETKEYLRTDNIHAMSREEEKNVAEKYGLRAVGQEVPAEEEKRRQTPEERYADRNKKRQEALKKARKAKKRKAFARKVKSHLPFVNNEEVELIRESESAVDTSDVDTSDDVEHSPLYGDKKDFFYNYDYPKDANAYAERMKLEESTHASTVDPSHKQKGRLSLESLKHITVDEKWRKANVPDHPWLRHFASADQDTDVSAWLKNGDIADPISEAVADASDITVKKTDTTNPNDHESNKAIKLSFYKNKEHIGTVFISGVDTRKGFLYDFKVAKKFRGMGYGTMIMKYVLSNYYVTDLSVDEDNKVAISLYKKFGFKRKQAFYDKSQKKTYGWYQRSSVLLHDNPIKEDNKLNETSTKVDNEDPLTKKELASLGIRDLRTLQRWMKNNIRYKNFTQLMTPREVLEEKKGSCHDQVVFEMAALKALGYSHTAYFVLEHDDKPNNSQGGETHSYVVVKDNGRLYWLENAWEQYAGVNEITNPKFIRQAHKERAWGDSNKFKELEVVRFAGQPGDSLQQLVDHCFNDKQEIDKPKKKESVVETGTPIWETYQFELEEPIQFLDRMDEAASNSSKSHVYTEPLYRITYNDIGIYEAYKKACSFDEWRSFINSDAATWLDVPKIYNKDINHTSYFTKRGYELFQKNTYPVIIQKLNKRNIKVDQVVLDVKPVYEDLYQVVVPNSVNESSIQDSYQFELLDKSVHFYDKIDEAASYQAKGKLYPVYVVLVHSGTGVSKAIKAISHSEYSHASICFDSSLDKMYSFARKDPRNPFIGGFRYESIGKGFYEQKEIPYAVYVVPCTESQVKKMKKRLNYFIQNQEKFTFDFTGLVTNYLGIVNNPAHRWFCSRFVADILNAGAPKNNPYVAEPSLQDPDDFKDTDWAIYVDSGENLMKYDRKKVDRKTNQIIRKEMLRRMAVNESAIFDLDAFNPFIESTLNYQFAMMDESVVDSFVAYLKSFKLKFDKDGNLIIRRREYDQLDQHFRASLRMIKAAEKAGDTGTVKDELCKINYMINLIQTQYMNQKTTDKNRKIKKEMEDLRSVMYNAFHQHLKWVVQMDPQFNFNSYYNSSKYGKDIVVDKKILTAAGKTIVTTLL